MENLQLIKGIENEDYKVIGEGLVSYNTSHVPMQQEKGIHPVNLMLKDVNGEIAGAVMARIYGWNAMEVSILWVAEKYRGKGLGKRLMNEVETIAIESNCTLIHLDTFDFQAPEFYKKLGFEVFGVLENSPTGHNRYYLSKKLNA
jgi:ribosomal protein S18 acetylase RimI-like enzyme